MNDIACNCLGPEAEIAVKFGAREMVCVRCLRTLDPFDVAVSLLDGNSEYVADAVCAEPSVQ